MNFMTRYMGNRSILNPIINYPIFFIFQFIIINAPVWAYWITQYNTFLRLYAILAVPITFFAAYILTIIVNKIHKLKLPIYIITYVLSVFEVYIILNFGVRFSHARWDGGLFWGGGNWRGDCRSLLFPATYPRWRSASGTWEEDSRYTRSISRFPIWQPFGFH